MIAIEGPMICFASCLNGGVKRLSSMAEQSCLRARYNGKPECPGPCKSQARFEILPTAKVVEKSNGQYKTLRCYLYSHRLIALATQVRAYMSPGSTTLIQQTASRSWHCVTPKKHNLNPAYNWEFRFLPYTFILLVIVCTLSFQTPLPPILAKHTPSSARLSRGRVRRRCSRHKLHW